MLGNLDEISCDTQQKQPSRARFGPLKSVKNRNSNFTMDRKSYINQTQMNPNERERMG